MALGAVLQASNITVSAIRSEILGLKVRQQELQKLIWLKLVFAFRKQTISGWR